MKSRGRTPMAAAHAPKAPRTDAIGPDQGTQAPNVKTPEAPCDGVVRRRTRTKSAGLSRAEGAPRERSEHQELAAGRRASAASEPAEDEGVTRRGRCRLRGLA